MSETKFKTLKDLMKPASCNNYAMLIRAGDLKAEAIKWVKEDLRCYDEMVNKLKNTEQEILISTEARIEWIKMFFNLTEEDLKDE